MLVTEYIFDTSAINALVDEPDSGALVAGIASTARAYVSSLSIVEAAATHDPRRRTDLLTVQKMLAGARRPLEDPRVLIRRLMCAYANCEPRVDIAVGEGNNDVWVAMSQPESVDEPARDRAHAILAAVKDRFRELHEQVRPAYQQVLEAGAARPRTAGAMLRAFSTNAGFLAEMIGPDYEAATEKILTPEAVTPLLAAAPDVAGYYAGWGHAVYSRAIAQSKYGDGTNPGAVDLWFGAYLPRCRYFVTNDRGQHKALRVVGAIIAPTCEVLSYSVFRRRVLLGTS